MVKQTTISYIDHSLEYTQRVFMGDDYSVATFGTDEIFLTVLQGDEDHPRFMIPVRNIITVEFDYVEEE